MVNCDASGVQTSGQRPSKDHAAARLSISSTVAHPSPIIEFPAAQHLQVTTDLEMQHQAPVEMEPKPVGLRFRAGCAMTASLNLG
jgi:hypothetical protein